MKIAASAALGQKNIFVCVKWNNQLVCLICNEVVSVQKEYKLKQHDEAKYLTIFKLVGVQMNEKLSWQWIKKNNSKMQLIRVLLKVLAIIKPVMWLVRL